MGKRVLRCVVILVLGAMAGIALARPPAPPLPDSRGPVLLGPYLEIFVDRDAKLGFEEVRAAEFKRSGEAVPSFGFTSSAVWLRFRLPPNLRSDEELLLEIRNPPLDRIEFYAPFSDEPTGSQYRRQIVGDTLPWGAREVKDRNYVFRLKAREPANDEFYVRVASQGSMVMAAYLWRPDEFAMHSRTAQVTFGFFYGLLLALIFYNLMLFISIQDRLYLYYVLYGIASGMWLSASDGFMFEYLGPDGGWWPNNGFATCLALSLFFGAHFARSFLDTAKFEPWSDRLLMTFTAIGAVLAICGATGWLVSYRGILSSISAIAILLAVTVLFVAVRALLAGYRAARFLLLAWAALLVSLIVYPLRNFGLLPETFLIAYSVHIGLALDLVLLSFALGDRVNLMKREAQLAKTEARAMQIATKHKSEFLANMSHELRTPLNAILGFSEMLRERYFGDLTAKQAEYVNDIREAGSHLLALINDILDLSKVEAGRMELDLSDFHFASAIDNAITLVRERATQHGISVHKNIDESLGLVRGDERKVKQILLNLLSNAVKFTPAGGQISVAAKPAGQMVEVSVMDTGVGISPEDQRSVFEEFKQVGKDLVRKAEGTGLGLALTKRFVELHGGTIRLQSAPGKGSAFFFTLPLAATPAPTAEYAASSSSPTRAP
jgi:signal transduction histidine kinase